MKKIFSVLTVALLLCALAAVVASCGGEKTPAVTTQGAAVTSGTAVTTAIVNVTEKPEPAAVIPTKAEITTPPEKTEYNEGDSLELGGTVATITYSNGTTRAVNVTADMLTGIKDGKVGKDLINFSYSEEGETVSTRLPVTVFAYNSGNFNFTGSKYVSTASDTVAIYRNGDFSKGEFSVSIKAPSNSNYGVIFGYSEKDGEESYYTFGLKEGGNIVRLEKVVNGKATSIAENYRSAGWNASGTYKYRVVIERGKVYCYFWNSLYFVEELTLDGTEYGIYSKIKDVEIKVNALNPDAKHDIANTLLFGHSYMEGWVSSYKTHLRALNMVKSENIGIGGSQAKHWVNFVDSVAAYKPKLGIYMIGINDYGSASPEQIASSVEEALLGIREQLPEFEVILINVNLCPDRMYNKSKIVETNKLYKAIADKYDWVMLADVENIFNDASGNPQAKYFGSDGLHPNANGYLLIAEAIKEARSTSEK